MFISPAVEIGAVGRLEMSGNVVRCPRCGSKADLTEGTFRITDDDVVEVLAASDLTRDRLERLSGTLFKARFGGFANDAEVASAIAKDAPQVSALYLRLSPRMRHALVAFLIAVVQMIAQHEFDAWTSDSATQGDVQQATSRLHSELEREQAATRSAIQQAVERALHDFETQRIHHRR